MKNFTMARHNMVESQVRPNGITDHRIIDAMAQVRREDFVPASHKDIAYLDEDVLIKADARGEARYLIEPMAFARMIHLATIKPTDRVLVVGAGSGYGAKIISMLAAQVTALESDDALAGMARELLSDCSNVEVVVGPLAAGHAGSGPYDVIVIEGRIAEVPESLIAQLKDEGRIVAAIGMFDVARINLLTVTGGHRSSRGAFDVTIAPLPGFAVAKLPFVFE